MTFELQEPAPDVAMVVLEGRIDFAKAQVIDAPLASVAAERRGMIIDLSRVDFVASMGLRSLLKCAKIMNSRQGRLALLSPKPVVADVIQMSGVGEMIPVFDSRDAAIAAVAPT
jgi:anti-anti-sigma factor